MAQKAKIQYVGQFYVHGSEARQLELEEKRKQARSRLPLERLRKTEEITLDPVAIGSILVSTVLLAVMVMSLMQIRRDWQEYNNMSNYVSRLNARNAELTSQYREGYDLEDIRLKAEAMGMVPRADLEIRRIQVEVPQREPEMTWLEEIQWFLDGLFE